MLLPLILKAICACCLCTRAKRFLFLSLPPRDAHHARLARFLFEEEEIEAVNPRVPLVERKPRPVYVMDDPLSEFRLQNSAGRLDSSRLNLTSLPYVQLEHQDKNKLVPFRDGREILAFYANKLLSFLANFKEWARAYDPEPPDPAALELYNPIAPNSYYALVFYCSWQSESIALVRALRQLLGAYTFVRDPPITHKKKPLSKEELLAEYARLQPQLAEYRRRAEEARRAGLPEPVSPDFSCSGPVKFTLRLPDVQETLRILAHSRERYGHSWWMPAFGKITYNRLVDEAFNELYNTSYRGVRSPEERKKYRLSDLHRALPPAPAPPRGCVNLNFVLVRLANSLMVSNSRQALRRHRRFVQCHEKEFRFNEIMLRLLLDQGLYYENMPAVQLFRCAHPLEALPSVFGSKSHARLPLEPGLTFYKRDPFAVAAHVNFGLPKLRKCNHLAVADDFVHLGTLRDLGSLRPADSFEDLFRPDPDFLGALARRPEMAPADLARLEPVLHALALMFKFHLRRIVEARPREPEYLVLSP